MKTFITKEMWARTLCAIIVVAAGILLALFFNNMKAFWGGVNRVLAILNPFIVGFAIAYLIMPPMRRVERLLIRLFCRKKPREKLCRVLAIVVTYLVALGALSAFTSVAAPQIVSSIISLSETLPDYLRRLVEQLTLMLTERGVPTDYFRDVFGTWQEIVVKAVEYVSSQIPYIISLSATISSGVINFFVGVIVSVYMLFGKEKFSAQLKKLGFALFSKTQVETLLHWTRESHRALGGYVSGKILDSAIVGVICYIGMTLMGLEYALLISVVVGVTNLIPFFGPFIGAIPSGLILLIVNPISALKFAIFILVLQQLDGNLIGPRVIGESIGLSSFWIMFAILLGGGLFGVAGMVLSIPVFAVIYAILQTLVEARLKARGLPVETSAYMTPEEPPNKEQKSRVEARGFRIFSRRKKES